MDRKRLHVYDTLPALSQAVASLWQQQAMLAIRQKGRFAVALAGGSTPKMLYQILAQMPYGNNLPWDFTDIYFGDERCVPLDHEDSNYRMAKESLFDHIALPAENIHPMVSNPDHPQQDAEAYATLLAESALPKNNRGVPMLDLVLLGMGDDGHIASLFPGSEVLNERARLTAASYVASKNNWRITLTYPVLQAARQVVMLVAGDSKAGVLDRLNRRQGNVAVLPIEKLLELREVDWYLDHKAARSLPRS